MFDKYPNRKIAVTPAPIRQQVTAKGSTDVKKLFKEFNEIKTENIPYAIEVLRELHPAFNFNSDKAVACLITFELECHCTEEQVKKSREFYKSTVEEDARLRYNQCVN